MSEHPLADLVLAAELADRHAALALPGDVQVGMENTMPSEMHIAIAETEDEKRAVYRFRYEV